MAGKWTIIALAKTAEMQTENKGRRPNSAYRTREH
jgi:hypothetical protein